MSTLFLDTAGHEGSAALCTEAETIAFMEIPQHDEAALIPAIEKMLQSCGKTYGDLTRCASVTGPGGFTSTRTGIATINALAYALKIPSAGIHLSEMWRLRMKIFSAGNSAVRAQHAVPLRWLHSTRKSHLFIRSLANDQTYPDPTLIDIETAAQLSGFWIGELIDEHSTALTNLQPLDPAMIMPLREALPQILLSLDYTEKPIEPWYGREG